jgi:hypothetical protein
VKIAVFFEEKQRLSDAEKDIFFGLPERKSFSFWKKADSCMQARN